MTTLEVDAVIAGGGLSGLSLAARLAAGEWRDRRVAVIDDTAARPKAVCWGFWSAGSALLDSAVSRTYSQIWIHAAGVPRLLRLDPYRYGMVRRPDLVRVVRELLDACPTYTIRPGRVLQMRDGPDGVETAVNGELIRSRWAFNSVSAPRSATADATLAFTGWEVHCERPVFDPLTPTLFDFRTRQDSGARFVYVLPDDSHRALVELTEFVPGHRRPPAAAVRGSAIGAYLRDVVRSGDYRILRTESAVLPLRVRPPARHGRSVLAIGARGGLVKATTGYAYQRIQRDSTAIVQSLERHGHPFDIPLQLRRHQLLDAALLDILNRDPTRLELTFAQLFANNPTERVLRFLDEDTNLIDELRLMCSVSPAPYLCAVARQCYRVHRTRSRTDPLADRQRT